MRKQLLLIPVRMGSDKVELLPSYDTVDAVPEAYRALYQEVEGKLVFSAFTVNPDAELQGRYDRLMEDFTALKGEKTKAQVGEALDTLVMSSKCLPDTGVATVKALLGTDFVINEAGILVNKDGVPASSLIANMKATHPFLWPKSQGAGGRSSSDFPGKGMDNPFSKEHWNLTKQAKLVNENQALAKMMAQSAGTTIGGRKPL